MPRGWGGTRTFAGTRDWQATLPTDFISEFLHQKAVYWASPTKDGYGGYTWNDPIEINCRWEDICKVIMDARGKEIISTAKVFVSQDLGKQGMLYPGYMANLTASQLADPKTISDAYEIKRFDKIPSIDEEDLFLRRAYL